MELWRVTNSGRSPQLGSESLHPSAARHRVRLHGGELFVLRTKSFMLRVRRNSSVTPEGVKALARGPPLARQQPTSVFRLNIILINKQTKKPQLFQKYLQVLFVLHWCGTLLRGWWLNMGSMGQYWPTRIPIWPLYYISKVKKWIKTLNVHEMTSVIKSPNLTPFSANHSLSSSFQFQFEPVEKISSFLHVGLSAVSKKISSPINTISDRAHLQGAM